MPNVLNKKKWNVNWEKFSWYLSVNYICHLQGKFWQFIQGPAQTTPLLYFYFIFQRCIYLFLERGEGKEEEMERNINMWLPLACPLLMTWPATQACTLTRNRSCDPLVCKTVLSPLSHTGQGLPLFYYKIFYYKIISMSFCNITISYWSTPYDILGEMFKLKVQIITPILLPYQPHWSRHYFYIPAVND